MAWWRMVYNEMVEWHEEKGDRLFDFVEFYGKEAAKVSKELHKR